ncbi:hypothetical protein D9756_010492 [Leucocoprinus leucothites]|uniref:Mago nashi n=1 Tax=Leucocoprinus leucothites TaxID=201217 RepID=A0A8H5FTR3_9AGAR|nr:hypothetical protein D9756_010492 [Leucoagaricus leucothites]
MADNDPFYLRYYTGHSGKHGHEFLEFEYSHGRLRYANNSNYRNDSLIRKESMLMFSVLFHALSFSTIYFPFALIAERHRRYCCRWRYCRFYRFSSFSCRLWIGPLVVKELKRIIESSEITKEDDANWPKKNIVGKQELEIRVGNDHISFETAKIGSLVDIQDSEDPEGLRVFYYLVQDLKCLIFSLISLHFKIKPI